MYLFAESNNQKFLWKQNNLREYVTTNHADFTKIYIKQTILENVLSYHLSLHYNIF